MRLRIFKIGVKRRRAHQMPNCSVDWRFMLKFPHKAWQSWRLHQHSLYTLSIPIYTIWTRFEAIDYSQRDGQFERSKVVSGSGSVCPCNYNIHDSVAGSQSDCLRPTLSCSFNFKILPTLEHGFITEVRPSYQQWGEYTLTATPFVLPSFHLPRPH